MMVKKGEKTSQQDDTPTEGEEIDPDETDRELSISIAQKVLAKLAEREKAAKN